MGWDGRENVKIQQGYAVFEIHEWSHRDVMSVDDVILSHHQDTPHTYDTKAWDIERSTANKIGNNDE